VKPGRPADGARLEAAAEALGVPLLETQVQCLLSFEALLRERGVPLGLVAEGDATRLLGRHIIDSLRAAAVVGPADQTALDLGSGAGLPGLVVAVACPSVEVALVEPRRRRAAFLELAIERLNTRNARVLALRAEDVSAQMDLCLARALAPLAQSWKLAQPLLRSGGRLAYFAGALRHPPSVPPGAASAQVAAEILVDSPGPLVIITRQ
jgi:16S rRNA (guanine527-N7)-methyltransferase